jgi:hypothetical protein
VNVERIRRKLERMSRRKVARMNTVEGKRGGLVELKLERMSRGKWIG